MAHHTPRVPIATHALLTSSYRMYSPKGIESRLPDSSHSSTPAAFDVSASPAGKTRDASLGLRVENRQGSMGVL